jgi:threonine/homoserine/homoserine lactone efflux protein
MFKFILAAFFVELTPGPNMAYLTALAFARGRAAGLIAVLGVALGLSVHAIVAALGAGELLLLYPWLYEGLRWTGIAYFMFLAWDGWQDAENSPSRLDLKSTSGPLFFRGLLSNVLNPKSALFFISVVPTFVRLAPGHSDFRIQMAIYGLIYVGIATTVHATIVMLAAQLSPWLLQGRRRTLVRRVLAVTLVLVAVWLIFATKR